MNDITLTENEIKYQSLFESARDAIFVINVEGMYIVDANKQACKLLQYTREELMKKKVFDLHPPEIRKIILQDFSDRVLKINNNLFETVI